MKKLFGEIDLTTGNIFKNLLFFTLPFFISFFLNSLYSAIDLMFIGKYADLVSSTAVSSGTTITFIINSVLAGLATGGTIVIGKYFGAKSDNMSKITSSFLSYMIIVTLFAFILMLCIFYPAIDWMNIKGEEEQKMARTYLFILVLGIPFYGAYTSLCGILRGLGNSFLPFIVLLIAVASNIAFDALFIIVFNMGSTGAAIATVIGEIIATIVSLIFVFVRKLPYEYKFKFQIDTSILKETVKSGLPIAIQDGLVVLSFAIIFSMVASRGSNYSSAVGITDRVTSFGFVPLSAVGSAVSTATAQNIGANKIDRVKKYMYYGLLIAFVLGGIMGAMCQIFPKQIASIFASNQPESLEIAVPYIRSTSLDIFVCIFVFPINAVFIGSGHSIFAMAQNLAATFLVRIPVAAIFAIGLNESLYVIGLAYCISTTFSLILCIIFYVSKKWMKPFKLNKKV